MSEHAWNIAIVVYDVIVSSCLIQQLYLAIRQSRRERAEAAFHASQREADARRYVDDGALR